MAKAPRKRSNRKVVNSVKQRKRLLIIPLLAFIIKLGIIARIQGFDWYGASNGNVYNGLTTLLDKLYQPPGAWYGADGENYLRGLAGLAQDGLFSTQSQLSYWPAGYPLLMWPLLLIFKGNFFGSLAVVQSLLYAIACIFFVDEIRQTRLVRFVWPIAIFLSFNPTLALNTIVIGYELPTVALTLIASASLLRHFRLGKKRFFSFESILAATSFSLASFMQPRLLTFAIVFFVIWAIANYGKKAAIAFLAASLFIVAVAPLTEMWRNQRANGYSAISTNLGTTMNIGAGPKSTGGYTNQATGVQCPGLKGNAAQQDSSRVRCVISWYFHNPVKTTQLAWNKSLYFWSPWVGPAANGTMARNPWAINHPIIGKVRTESGIFLAWKSSGKPISWNLVKWSSWLWMLTTLLLMIYGFAILWQSGGVERLLGLASFSMVLVNWLSTIATIGDHRFRIPSMGMSLFLQVVGFVGLFLRGRNRLVGASREIHWPSLRWSSERSTDNLPS